MLMRMHLSAQAFLIGDLVLETEDERRETVESLNSLPLRLIFACELLGLLHHTVDFLLRQTTLLVGDGNRLRFATVMKSCISYCGK